VSLADNRPLPDDLHTLPLVFISEAEYDRIVKGERLPFDPEKLHHYRKVLRKAGVLDLYLSNGKGGVLFSRLDQENFLSAQQPHGEYLKKRPCEISVITVPIKKKGLDVLIQKLSELGVSSITLIHSQYQSTHPEPVVRLEKIAENGCEQSRNPLLPEISLFEGFLESYRFSEDTLYCWGDPKGESPVDILEKQPLKKICFINGPEGGWSPEERIFLKNRFRSIRLSENVLRSETAAIVAAGIITQYCSR